MRFIILYWIDENLSDITICRGINNRILNFNCVNKAETFAFRSLGTKYKVVGI